MISFGRNSLRIQANSWESYTDNNRNSQKSNTCHLGQATVQMTVGFDLFHPDIQLNDCQDKGKHHGNIGQIGIVHVDVLV